MVFANVREKSSGPRKVELIAVTTEIPPNNLPASFEESIRFNANEFAAGPLHDPRVTIHVRRTKIGAGTRKAIPTYAKVSTNRPSCMTRRSKRLSARDWRALMSWLRQEGSVFTMGLKMRTKTGCGKMTISLVRLFILHFNSSEAYLGMQPVA